MAQSYSSRSCGYPAGAAQWLSTNSEGVGYKRQLIPLLKALCADALEMATWKDKVGDILMQLSKDI